MTPGQPARAMFVTKPVVGGRRIRFALAGCGRISANHFEAMATHADACELVGVCDVDPAALAAATAKTGSPGFPSLDAMLAGTDADCVVLATPSMLQSGLSRDLFEAWCGDARNGVIIADFAVQGTLAREILGAPETVLARSGERLPLRCSVDAISFSAHADFEQTSGFVDELAPPHVVLVHGEAGEMGRLQRALQAREAQILRLYFGLDHPEPLTLEQIGAQLGITRERVRQIKERALLRLRHAGQAAALESFLA